MATGVFTLAFGALGILDFWRFHVRAFDVGIFAQGTWLLGEGKWPFFITVRGLPLFADHSSYILVLLAPLYLVFPSPVTLIVVGVIALATVGPLAFMIARRAGAGPILAGVTGVLVLFQPAVQWQVEESFHPEILVIPLAVAAVALVQRGRDGWAIAAVVVALAAKEDVGLLVVPLGLVIAWVMGRKRTGLTMAGLGLVAFLVNFLVLLPAWSPSGELLYSYRYESLGQGPIGIAVGLLTKPDVWFDVLTDPRRIGYVAALIGAIPLAVLAPRWLLVAVPTLLANLFSNHGYQYDVRFHYTAYLIVVMSIAAAYGGARLERWPSQRMRSLAIAITIASAAVTSVAAAPWGVWAGPHEHHRQITAMVELIPDGEGVSAWTTFVPHLADREIIHKFPNPFVEHYYGAQGEYGALGSDVPDPSDVDWVMIRRDSYEEFDDLIEGLVASPEFEVVVDDPPFLLLHRRG